MGRMANRSGHFLCSNCITAGKSVCFYAEHGIARENQTDFARFRLNGKPYKYAPCWPGFGSPVSVEQVAGGFNGRTTPKRLAEVSEILEMLAALGQVVEREGKFAQT